MRFPWTSRAGRIAFRVLILLICIGAVAWMAADLDPGRTADLAADADQSWLVLSFVPILARFAVWAFKWRIMLAGSHPISYPEALRAVLAGAFINLVTPTAKLAGGTYRAAVLKRTTRCRLSTALGWTLADQVTNLMSNLGLFGLLALLAGAARGGPNGTYFLWAGACSLSLLAAMIAVRPFIWKRIGFEGRLRRAAAPLLSIGAGWRQTLRDLMLSAVSWLMLCVANFMTFRALGVDVPLFEVTAILVLGAFAGSLTGLGGAGATEATMVGLYRWSGMDGSIALAAPMLHRAALYIFILIAGGICVALTPVRSDGVASE